MNTQVEEPQVGSSINHKRCAHCRVDKPHSHFSKDSKARDGLQYYCKGCKGQLHALKTGKAKQCTKCGEVKELDQYYTGRKGKKITQCKTCVLAYQKNYVAQKQEEWKVRLERERVSPQEVRENPPAKSFKVCKVCKENKEIGAYYLNSRGYATCGTCKICSRKTVKKESLPKYQQLSGQMAQLERKIPPQAGVLLNKLVDLTDQAAQIIAQLQFLVA